MSSNKRNNNSENRNQEKGTKKVKKRKLNIVKVILLALLIVILVVGVNFGIKVYKNGGGASGIVGALVGTDEKTLAKLPKIYCLLLGQSQGLTDTMMLASYDPKTQEAALLTIPRDTFVGKNKATARPEDKINSLWSVNPEKTMKAVREITGINVTNYCLIDTRALREMVDVIGGVYFDVPIDMDYDDFTQDLYVHVKAGYQLLNGDTAEGVVRFRHNQDGSTYPEEYGHEDIGRSRTQRAFLTELAKQTLKPSNIFKIGEFIDIFYDNVKTNMNISDIKDYLPYIINFDTSKLKTGIVPGDVEFCNIVYVYLHDKEGTKKIVEELFGEQVDSTEEPNENPNSTSENKNINIELLNGTDNENALFNVKNKLEENGYTITKTGKTNKTSNTTIINRANLKDKALDELEQLLGKGSISEGENSGKVDVTIIIGNDY